MDSTLAIGLATLAAGIVTKLINVWERRAQTQRDDRKSERERLERAQAAAAVAAAVRIQADRVAHATSEQTARVIEKLDANTQLTAEARAEASSAYAAGNDNNTKFLKIHTRIDRVDVRIDELTRLVKDAA